MDENRFEGAARNLGGKVETAVGNMIGDTKLKTEAAVDKVAGKAQHLGGQAADAVRNTVGQAADKVRNLSELAGDYGSQVLDQVEEYGDMVAEQIDARPITALLIAAGVGFLLAMATKPAPVVVYRRR